MLTCSLGTQRHQPLTILCLGAHSDDLEIGCGGTMLKLLAEHPGSTVTWIVFSGPGARETEARLGAALFTRGAQCVDIRVLQFRDGFFPYQGEAIKEYFETIKTSVQPDLILTHHRHDRHQDHRTISDLTWNTFRSHLIWEYEIPKFDGDFGSPELFMALDDATVDEKCRAICATFASQHVKHWLSEELLRSVLRIRGMETGGTTRYAEAFYIRKITL